MFGYVWLGLERFGQVRIALIGLDRFGQVWIIVCSLFSHFIVNSFVWMLVRLFVHCSFICLDICQIVCSPWMTSCSQRFMQPDITFRNIKTHNVPGNIKPYFLGATQQFAVGPNVPGCSFPCRSADLILQEIQTECEAVLSLLQSDRRKSYSIMIKMLKV